MTGYNKEAELARLVETMNPLSPKAMAENMEKMTDKQADKLFALLEQRKRRRSTGDGGSDNVGDEFNRSSKRVKRETEWRYTVYICGGSIKPTFIMFETAYFCQVLEIVANEVIQTFS